MNAFDVAAILVAGAAVFGYVNHRFLRLPSTSGTLLVALVSSLVVVLIDRVVPGFDLRSAIEGFLGEIDFDQTLMHGLLCFLLFAGALHVDLEGLIRRDRLSDSRAHAAAPLRAGAEPTRARRRCRRWPWSRDRAFAKCYSGRRSPPAGWREQPPFTASKNADDNVAA